MSELTSHQMSHRTETISWFAKAWWWGPSWPVVEEQLGLHQLSDQFQRFRWGYILYVYMFVGFVWTWATQKFDSLDIGFFINMVIWYIQFSVRPIFVSAQRTFSLDVLSCKVLLTSGRFLLRTLSSVGTVGVDQMSTLPWSKRLCHLLIMWVWVNTYRYIFSGMNIHLPAILGFTRYQGFDPSPCCFQEEVIPRRIVKSNYYRIFGTAFWVLLL